MARVINLLAPMSFMMENLNTLPVSSICRQNQTTVKYIGHSCYLITAPDGTRIITDPYGVFPPLQFPIVNADLVTISHEHLDHNADERVGGHPVVLRTPTVFTAGMLQVKSYVSVHPEYRGVKCSNHIFVFQVGDVKIVHLGELGEIPAPKITEAIKDANAIFFSIGFTDGLTTLRTLNDYVMQLNAHILIPGHYSPSAEDRWYGMATIGEYLSILNPVTKIVVSEELILHNELDQLAVLRTASYS